MKQLKVTEVPGGYQARIGNGKTVGFGITIMSAIINLDDQNSTIRENKPYFEKKKKLTKK